MNYRVTKGDLEITKNVLTALVKKLGNKLNAELKHFDKQTDCPTYDIYNQAIDTLVYLDNNSRDLTN